MEKICKPELVKQYKLAYNYKSYKDIVNICGYLKGEVYIKEIN